MVHRNKSCPPRIEGVSTSSKWDFNYFPSPWPRGYAYDLNPGSELFEMNSRSRRVCVDDFREPGVRHHERPSKNNINDLFIQEDPRTGQTLVINLLRSFLSRYAR
jgi:hypothetical protein